MVNIELNPIINDLITQIHACGGQVYIVGGFIRDYILGIENYDIDMEVYHLDFEELVDICQYYDETMEVFGKYGIIKLPRLNVDLSMPKKELKVNDKGYHSFKYLIDKDMKIQEASLRRDLTINCIYFDCLNHQLVDLHQGKQDCINKRCRLVNPHFEDDPIRLLRLIYFVIKYDLHIDQTTYNVIHQMSIDEVSSNKLNYYLNKITNVHNYQELLVQKQLKRFLPTV